MHLKDLSAIALAFLCCNTLAKAEDLPKDSTESIVNNAGGIAVRPIDPLLITHASDPGKSHFKSLLKRQLSPLKMKLGTSANEHVQSFINKFSSHNYRFHLSKMLGLSQYYFPIFEKAFKEIGIPDEIKYLAIIESALNPHAVSRVGATGPWQFMYATAKDYGLTIDSYKDERKDPIAASYAAANYLKEAFDLNQDWFLAIASYNCGRGNVSRAIERSGLTKPSFWDIMHLLPQETRNYIPAFIAMHHVLGNAEKYGIDARPPAIDIETEIIMVDRQISLPSVAKALSIEEEALAELNPAYKRKIIKGTVDNLQRLVVPVVDKAFYIDLYYALQGETNPSTLQLASVNTESNKANTTSTYQVQPGESLHQIALRFDISVQDLKAWNNLKTNTIVPKQVLKIKSDEDGGSTIKPQAPQYLTYRVKKGDTLSAISKRYNIKDISTLKALNNLKSSLLKPGMVLKLN